MTTTNNPKTDTKLTRRNDQDETLLLKAKERFADCQKGLLIFWVTLETIREHKSFKAQGHKSFEAYCSTEFSFDYSTISKHLSVLNEYRKHIENLKPNKIPWDTAYRLLLAKQNISEPKYAELTVEVLTGKLTRNELSKELNSLESDQNLRAIAEVEALTEADMAETENFEFDEETLLLTGEVSQIEMEMSGIEARVAHLLECLPTYNKEHFQNIPSKRLAPLKDGLKQLRHVIDLL
ncbi:MAG: hypothetical protein SGJ18_05415 [Pseudomonadota bacterium]|nr:hypothetical protein [Pseudomonadota bacterium]